MRAPVHPGEILLKDFLEPMGITRYALGKACGLSATHVGEIVRGARSITGPVALLLGKYFNVDPAWWMNMQAHYDLQLAARDQKIQDKVRSVEPLAA
jgi:antitoxin HigA-1